MPRRVPIPVGPDPDAIARARAYAPYLRPGERFSHTTAAALWGVPLPRRSMDLHISTLLPRNRARGGGVVGHRTNDPAVVRRHGLPVSTPGALFLELAMHLALDDLVAVGDALVLDPHVLDPLDLRPWTTMDDLISSAGSSRAPGCRLARRALMLVRHGAESRPETLLRLLLVRAGLPEPELNQEIRDSSGRFIGRGDLVYREARVIVEYDGDQHRTSKIQYEHDITRLERFRDARWAVVQVRERGLFVEPDRTIARVRRALATTS